MNIYTKSGQNVEISMRFGFWYVMYYAKNKALFFDFPPSYDFSI